MEVRDRAPRDHGTSRRRNDLDPTRDPNVGDIARAESLTDAYAGLGVPRRSGIFGQSRALGNVKRGASFIDFYVESLLSF